jgi:hypothetical protein
MALDGWTGADPYREEEQGDGELTPESRACLLAMIAIARSLVSGRRFREPIEIQILSLARTVVELADHGKPS